MFILLLILFFIFPNRVLADTKVNVVMIGDYFDGENNLDVKIEVDPPDQTDLKIRPRIEPDQILFVYASDSIFSLGSFWTDLPSIPKDLTLHTPIPFNTANIWFEVQDAATGKVYETPKKQVYGRKFVESYIADLNKSLFGW